MLVPSTDLTFLELQLALAGRYSIDRELGRGGMGIVYLAREVHLDRPVAIKLLPPDRATPQLRERFLREARLAARLSHPNIIPIHAVEETDRFVYFAMAYIDGETLSDRVRTRGPLGASEGTRVLREVAWALACAHGQGLVHRDVKPDNILLERASGRVLVADFGIAAAIDEARAGEVAGTPEFMSPEQILDGGFDARSDIYSLGATAYYAFSGRYVFEGTTPTEVMAKHVSQPPAPLGSLGLPVPRKVARLVDRCLAKDPDQRIPTAQLFAEQMGVALEQRRELPMALRAFVKRTARLDGGGTLAGATVLSSAVAYAGVMWGLPAAIGTLAVVLLAPLGYFIKAARQISLLGFTHRDLPAAFQAELEQTEDEMSHAASGPPSIVERWLPRAVRISGSVLGVGLASTLALSRFLIYPWSTPERVMLHRLLWDVSSDALAYGAIGLTISVLALVGLGQRRKDIDTAFWARLWTGRVGEFAFAIGRRLVGRRAIGPAQTHRATELSLGIAAEQLFDALPKRTRQQLGDVPAVLRRLQEDASLMRSRHDELQEALALHGEMPGTEAYQELCRIRDAAQARLADAVAALETIRLDLLRLHAGADAVSSLTTHLGVAAEVSAEVHRLVAARAEIDHLLAYPRGGVATVDAQR